MKTGDTVDGEHPAVEELSALFDGQLAENEARAVRAHLDACPSCAAQLAELRATVSLLSRMPAAAPPRSFRVPRPAQERRGLIRVPTWLFAPPTALRAFAGVAAAVMLVLFIGDAAFQPVRQERPVSLSAPAPAASDAAPAAAQANQESRGALPAQRAPFASGGAAAAPSPVPGEAPAISAPREATTAVTDAASARTRPAETPGWWTTARAAAAGAGLLAVALLMASFVVNRRT